MPKLDREQAIAVAALALLLFLCVGVVGLLLQARADAVREASNGTRYCRASKPGSGRPQAGQSPWRPSPPSSMRRPRASRARSCNHIWRIWPTIRAPALSHQAEKRPSATMRPTRFGFKPRLI